MKYTCLFAAAVASTLLFAGAANATVYTIEGQDVPPGTVSGTITTDGALGALTLADITSTDLTVSDSSNTVALNGVSELSGSSLTATSTGLFFDYSGIDNNYYAVFDSAGTSAYCIATGEPTCFFILNNEVIEVANAVYQGPVESGEVQIATASAVPEPATWALMLVGFGTLGGIAHRRRAMTAVVA
jgi:hypothetical protein